jgi:DNA-binding response OmpR family regulator/signal transduction histidine kinase
MRYYDLTLLFLLINAIINPMGTNRDRILIVENDADICDLIGRQALQSMGYQVQTAGDAQSAIAKAIQFVPDIMIVDLNLPSLSGKDLMVALSSQGIATPIIALTKKGGEEDLVQSFRLGATDFLLWPVREAEVVAVVERVLKQVHDRRERERLDNQLQQTNLELQNRVRELTTIFSIGKAVTSVTDQSMLFDKIVDGALKVSNGDLGWFLVRDEGEKSFILSAHQNLPTALHSKLNHPWDDGISSLVAMSGETLAIHGEPLKRFKVNDLGQSALIAPIKVQKQVIALLVIVRRAPRPFNGSEQKLVEAVADYASISLVNARLFRALEERARYMQRAAESAQAGEKSKNDFIKNAGKELTSPLEVANESLDQLSEELAGSLPNDQLALLETARMNLSQVVAQIDKVMKVPTNQLPNQMKAINIVSLGVQAIEKFKQAAEEDDIILTSDFSNDEIFAYADPQQVAQVFDKLLTTALRQSSHGGHVSLRVEKMIDGQVHGFIKNTTTEIETNQLPPLGEHSKKEPPPSRRSENNAQSIAQVKELVSAHGGKVWVESSHGQGSVFHFTLLPPA